ncbi:ankyrin repeat-containing protein BDA1-like [Syzygium oleosum]|uniref:ankyrin repeat-containing protein BDA1-like n=1 Tax=Syzygium oleosum TaxID=219896 RepID=UPI0011D26E0F|nr:ankyrin repeat-containing protein BDA1-like [Syzygium oleosum]
MILQVRHSYFHPSSTGKAPRLLHFPPQTMTLQKTIAADDVNELYSLIERDENLLDHGSESPFPNTPLHDAANQGKTKVAMEIAILKPSFARKLNRGGHSPMHLALQKKHYHTARALMTLDPKLIRVRGRGGITPLHFVAREKGDNEQDNVDQLELLAEFLFACKSSIEDLTSQCETAVHVAVKNHNTKAFEVLCGWLKRVNLTQILKWKDQNGETVLHIAVSGEQQPEIIKLLIGYTNVHAKNLQGKTALQIFLENPNRNQDVENRLRRQEHRARCSTPTLSLSKYFSMELTVFEKYAGYFGTQNENVREILLIVSTLIVTATYQAAFTPPGGYWQDSSSNTTANSTVVTTNSSSIAIGKPHHAGNLILSGKSLLVFTIVNSLVFTASIGTVWATAITLYPDTLTVYLSLCLLSIAYFVFVTIEIPKSDKLIAMILGGFYECSLATMLLLPAYVWFKHNRVLSRIDATRRRVGGWLGSEDRK